MPSLAAPEPSPDVTIVEHPYTAYGASAALFRCEAPEVLIVGAAGTGKTRCVLEKINYLAEKWPGMRALLVRKTRASMAESVLVTYERDVLTPGHPGLEGATRANRHSYVYPNGSEVVTGGLDKPERTFSTEYDVVAVFEATEATEDDWEKLHRALRNHVVPFQQAIADCNPSYQHHWLNKRADTDLMVRLYAHFEDNPTITEDYLERLDRLTGPRRARLYLGLWVTAEGQIWENWDDSVHIIDAIPTDKHGDSVIEWFFASVDWGFISPGVLQVWGVDRQRRAYLVYEVYQTHRNIDWWAEKAATLDGTYGFRVIVCDPSEPGDIDLLNRRIGRAGGKRRAIGASKDRDAGLHIVRERLAFTRAKQPGLFVLRGCMEAKDPDLVDAHKPIGLAEEIPGYVWREMVEGKAIREEPAPGGDDHSCDTARYAMTWLDISTYRPQPHKPKDFPGTFGYVLGHEATWAAIKRGDFQR